MVLEREAEDEGRGVELKTIRKRYYGPKYDEWMKGYLSLLDQGFVEACARTHHSAAWQAAKKGGQVVELAVGSGRNVEAGYYYHPNLQVLGIDVCSGMLESAERKVKRLGYGNIQLKRGDARDALSYVNANQSDLTVMTYGLCVTPQPRIVLENLLELTKPGGLIFITDYVFAQNPRIQKEQEEIAPLTRTDGMRFYDSKEKVPSNEQAIEYHNGAILAGADEKGHSIVWDASFDLRSLIAAVFADKVAPLKLLESEKDKVQSNLLFLGRKR